MAVRFRRQFFAEQLLPTGIEPLHLHDLSGEGRIKIEIGAAIDGRNRAIGVEPLP